jgi:hypothetical protein
VPGLPVTSVSRPRSCLDVWLRMAISGKWHNTLTNGRFAVVAGWLDGELGSAFLSEETRLPPTSTLTARCP